MGRDLDCWIIIDREDGMRSKLDVSFSAGFGLLGMSGWTAPGMHLTKPIEDAGLSPLTIRMSIRYLDRNETVEY